MLLAGCSAGTVQAAEGDLPSAAHSLIQTPESAAVVIVVVGILGLLGAVNLTLEVWNKLKPKPSYEKRFAAINHTHAGTITDAECIRRHEQLIQETRHSVKHETSNREALQRQLDGVRQELKENDRKAEERASETHSRINSLAAPLNSLLGRFNDHLDQHKEHKHDRP